MNEELQSTNDELQSINEMLRDRTLELDQLHGFLDSVTGSLHAGLVSVDAEQRVRLWNAQAEELWGLRAEEAIGEAFADLDIGLPVERLGPLLGNVLGGVDGITSVQLSGVNRRGRSTETLVTVVPLAEADGVVRGALLLMEPVAG